MNFDAKKVKDDLVRWIQDTFEANGKGCNAVVGISGGKDSSVVAALCVEALGENRVIGVLMPNGEQSDIDDAKLLVNHLDINCICVNIKESVNAILKSIRDGVYNETHMYTSLSKQTQINLPARIRMATLYAIAQSWNGRVINTCNLSEDWVGYSTRYGDSAGDFAPLALLTTDEVVAIGEACGLPDKLVHKTPSDGLCGKTDEDNLGFSYSVLNHYIRSGYCDNEEIKSWIDYMHEKNLFKLKPMPMFDPNIDIKI